MQVCQFNNATCGTFQALSQRGYLNVNVQNIGTISADYQLTVLIQSSPIMLLQCDGSGTGNTNRDTNAWQCLLLANGTLSIQGLGEL